MSLAPSNNGMFNDPQMPKQKQSATGAGGLLGNVNIKGLQLASLLGMLAEALGQDSIGGNLGQFAQQASAGPLKVNALQQMMKANQGVAQEPMGNFPLAPLMMAGMLR